MNSSINNIICLTEESVETLFLLGKGDLISGVSSYAVRPPEVKNIDKVSLFTSSKYDKIVAKNPDIVLGFSDIQASIASELVKRGLDVWIANHRSLDGIISYIYKLSLLVDAKKEGILLINKLNLIIDKAREKAASLSRRPKVYFEEWDDPKITAIKWVADVIDLCGGDLITKDIASGSLAQERVVSDDFVKAQDPDIIFLCWCGKRAKIDKVKSREGWNNIKAVKFNNVFELEPEIFLQPGPAIILDGIRLLLDYFERWNSHEC